MKQQYCSVCKEPLPLQDTLPPDVVLTIPVNGEGYFTHKKCLPDDRMEKYL